MPGVRINDWCHIDDGTHGQKNASGGWGGCWGLPIFGGEAGEFVRRLGAIAAVVHELNEGIKNGGGSILWEEGIWNLQGGYHPITHNKAQQLGSYSVPAKEFN